MLTTRQAHTIGQLCRVVRGISPTLKTEPGDYPLVVTAAFRRTSTDWQVEGPAVCVPLISSTGHGDAALHRVHYQEGRFALANLLVALIPRDSSVCDARYLYQLLQARKDVLFVPLMSGTANVSLKERDIAAVEITLPPIDEQRRIVARIEECAGKVEETRRIRDEAVDELKALRASGKHHWFDAVLPHARLGDVCEVIDPNPSHRYPTYVPNGVPMITTSDFVGDDGIDSSRAKHVPRSFFDDTLGRFGIQDGDVIFARKGKIGYARLYPADSALAMTHTLCVLKPNRALLETKYLLHFARSAHFLRYLTGTMNPNLGVPTLGLNVIRDASIPLPSLGEQRHIARQMDALEQRIGLVENLQAETAAELDAMLPAILDMAFKGDL